MGWIRIAVGACVIVGVSILLYDCDVIGTKVPRNSAGECVVRRRDTKPDVVAKCGEGCAVGVAPKGACSSGWQPYCGNECDIYGAMAVCYPVGGSVVVQVVEIPGSGVRATPCKW